MMFIMLNIYHTNRSWDLYHKHQPFYIHWSMNRWFLHPKDSYPTGIQKIMVFIDLSMPRTVSSLIKLARYRSPWREHTLFFCIPKSTCKTTTFFINKCLRWVFCWKNTKTVFFSTPAMIPTKKRSENPRALCFLRLSAIHQCLYVWFSSWCLWYTNTKNMWLPCKVSPFCQFYIGLFHPYKWP